jgi:hypothetical protein
MLDPGEGQRAFGDEVEGGSQHRLAGVAPGRTERQLLELKRTLAEAVDRFRLNRNGGEYASVRMRRSRPTR